MHVHYLKECQSTILILWASAYNISSVLFFQEQFKLLLLCMLEIRNKSSTVRICRYLRNTFRYFHILLFVVFVIKFVTGNYSLEICKVIAN